MKRYFLLALVACLLLATPCWADTLKIGECADCDGSITPDTRLREDLPHNNSGASVVLTTGWAGGNEFRSIIGFPLDQEELIGATITAATFECVVAAIGDGGNTTIEIHEIAAANLGWIEGTKTNAAATAGEPDWVHFSHTSPVTTWVSAGLGTGGGTDYIDAVYGSFNGTSVGLKTAILSEAAITYLNNKIGGAAEFLLFTSDGFSANEYTLMSSSEEPITISRPFLELIYDPVEPPAAVAAQVMIVHR